MSGRLRPSLPRLRDIHHTCQWSYRRTSEPGGQRHLQRGNEVHDARFSRNYLHTHRPRRDSHNGSGQLRGAVATFTPGASLTVNTVYTATISTGAQDLAGRAMGSNYVWSF